MGSCTTLPDNAFPAKHNCKQNVSLVGKGGRGYIFLKGRSQLNTQTVICAFNCDLTSTGADPNLIQGHVRLVQEGKHGRVGSVLANFGFIPEAPVPDRLFNPALGGGTLLDIGIYNVFFAISVLGRPHQVIAHMTPASTGIDQQCAVTLLYQNGAIAQLFSSFEANLPIEAEISGPQGRIRLTTRFYEPTARIQWYPGRIDSRTEIPVSTQPGWGYHYQARHVQECLRQGLKESPMWSHSDTLLLMETMDRIRQAAGIVYPADQPAV